MATSAVGGGVSTVPAQDDVSKPPEGIVLPPKDIRGKAFTLMLSAIR